MRVSNISFAPVQADIRFLLPCGPGERVWLIQGSPSLKKALSDGGTIQVVTAEDGTLLSSDSMDHIVIGTILAGDYDGLLSEAVRVLKRGGTLFVGARHVHRGEIQRALCRLGFEIVSVCGVRDNLRNPQYFIPLEHPAATSYFFEQLHAPISFHAELLRRLAKTIAILGLHRFLYREFTILVRKK